MFFCLEWPRATSWRIRAILEPTGPVVVDEDGRRVETVYENPRFPRFYHSNR